MPSNLDPKTLQALRNEKHLSQAELAVKCDCTPETVGRWERGKAKVAQQRFKDYLCAALGVPWEALCRPYQRKNEITSRRAADDGREEILRNLNARVSHQAHLAFTLASQRYGVRIADIVELAPLLFMVAAEQCLADRATKLAFVNDAGVQLDSLREVLPQFSAVLPRESYELDEALLREQEAIESRDLYGGDHWRSDDWDAPDNDPWARHLRTMVEAAKVAPELIETINSGNGVAPSYDVGITALKAITGLNGETEAERLSLELIRIGLPDVRELLAKKKSLSDNEFRDWLEAQQDLSEPTF